MNLDKFKNILSRHVNDPTISDPSDPRLHKKLVNTVDLECILNFVPSEVEIIFRRKYGLPQIIDSKDEIDCAAGHPLVAENAGKVDPKFRSYEDLRDKEIKKKANDLIH